MLGRLERKWTLSRWIKCLVPTLFVIYFAFVLVSVTKLPASLDHSIVPPPSSQQQQEASTAQLESLSSVDYFACCGLGHRLIRMSLAHYVAKVKGFALRSFWGWCGERQPIEVFSYLFHPPSQKDLATITSQNVVLPFYNEVPGFVAVSRNPNQTCPCHADKIHADFELYSSLRNRFRSRHLVDAFVKKHFQDHTVIGIHVRAGNGEGGDFERKGRTIQNPKLWVQQVSQLLQSFLQNESMARAAAAAVPPPPPLLYIATDTPSMVTLFREEFQSVQISVLDLPQQGRREEGQGVLFGVSDKVHNKDGGTNHEEDEDDYSNCLKGWTDTLMDMFLLSHADVVVAATPSSFSQTAPMSLAFGNHRRKLSPAYCEVVPRHVNTHNHTTRSVLELQCYSTYQEWCCNYSTWIQFRHPGPKGTSQLHSKEFVKFLPLGTSRFNFTQRSYRTMRNRSENCPRPRRGRIGGGLKDKCIPHHW